MLTKVVAAVVTVTVLLATEIFPAASFAFTLKLYEVDAAKPDTANDVTEVVVLNTPFW